MYFIYILESLADGSYYVGYTQNVEQRVFEHNNSLHPTFSSKLRPWKLKAAFELNGSAGEAMKAEKFIKKQKSRAFIDKICNMQIVKLPVAQLVRVPDREAPAD